MSRLAAELLLTAVGLYLGLGLVFAVPFLLAGVARIDPRARQAGLGFRLMILPGVAIFWPLLARRWLRLQPPPEEGNAHRRAAARGRGR